jgi:hypothetical protein
MNAPDDIPEIAAKRYRLGGERRTRDEGRASQGEDSFVKYPDAHEILLLVPISTAAG